MTVLTRRRFLTTSATVAAGGAAASRLVSPTIARAATLNQVNAERMHRLADGWEFFRGPLGSPWEVWHNEELAVFEPVSMPHCFNAYDGCDPDTPYYRGQGWYRTWIHPANPYPAGRTLLHFWGAGQQTTVYLGETKVGEHKGGYDEFVFDISDTLANTPAGPHGVPLAVLCDNSRRMDTMPSDFSDFSLYGGLYRHVELLYLPAIALAALHITIADPAAPLPKAIVSLRFHAPGRIGVACHGSLTISDPHGDTIHQSKHTLQVSETELQLPPIDISHALRWSPASPKLYTCTLTLDSAAGSTSMTQRFGVRHAEFLAHGPFKLNGERLLLRGTHRHEDHAGYAAAVPDNIIRQEMTLIKQMGANFIRLAHYQQSRLVLELCDELGLCVWEEVPWCRGSVGDDAWQQMGRDKLTAMIDQHRNHPSVILWGLGNEDDWPTEYPSVNKDAIRNYMTELRDLAHTLDPTRLTSFRRCDFARDIPDVYSPSIWAGWYRGLYTEYEPELKEQAARVERFIHIEWGADSHARRHSETPDKVESEIATGKGADERGLDYLPTGGIPRVSVDGDWSETYACNLFDWHLKVQEAQPWLTGAAQWIFKDFTTPLRVENPVPRINQKGVVERDLTKKESYFVFQSYWADKPTDSPMIHIYGHTWPIRWGRPDEPKLIKVYSNCDEVELFLGGRSLGSKRRNSQDFPAAGLRWTTTLPAGNVELHAVGKRHGNIITDEIRFRYETQPWGAPARIDLTQQSRNGKLVTLQATLCDAAGAICLDARNVVRFSVAGDGKMLDNRGTVGGSRVVQLANGRAWITVDLAGGCIAGVSSKGVPSAFLTLRA